MRFGAGATGAGIKRGSHPILVLLRGLIVTLPLDGCVLSGDKPEPGLDIPQAYSAGPKNPKAAEAALPSLDWWRAFGSRELTEIIEEARDANLDIAAAVARIVQADANARIGGAALLPAAGPNSAGPPARFPPSRGGVQVPFLASVTAGHEIDYRR